MDLVQSVLRSATKHQHVLIVIEYTSQYLEVIPLRNTFSKVIIGETKYVVRSENAHRAVHQPVQRIRTMHAWVHIYIGVHF